MAVMSLNLGKVGSDADKLHNSFNMDLRSIHVHNNKIIFIKSQTCNLVSQYS